MPDRFIQTYGELPPDYWPDAPEAPEPARLCDPRRLPGIDQDLASLHAADRADEPVDVDMTVGVGEDPGWHRTRPAPRWKAPGRPDVSRQT